MPHSPTTICQSPHTGNTCQETNHTYYEGQPIHTTYLPNGRPAIQWIDQTTPHWIA